MKEKVEIKIGNIVSHTYVDGNYVDGPREITGWFRVTRVTKKTVNLGGVWNGKVAYKGVPIEDVTEDGEAFYENWERSDSYRCM